MERIARMIEETTDRDLLAECGNGSREAFEAFFHQNQKRVYSVALNFFGGDPQAAEDITQQVFLKIFTRFENFRGDADVKTWLYRVTTNACIDEHRKKKRFSFFADLFGFKEPKTKRTPDKKLESREISGEVRKALATIDVKFRLPILLKYVEGLSYREIADVLDCPEGTIASRLNRGASLLARKLEHLKGKI